MELADTSVWARKTHPFLRDWFASAIEAGEIAGCDRIALELLHSARNPPEFALVEEGLRRQACPGSSLTPQTGCELARSTGSWVAAREWRSGA